MKKIVAICVAFLLLFITTGYHFTALILQQHQHNAMQQKLNNTLYAEDALIEISLPISVPYYSNSNSFERIDGQVEINGVTYTYVKKMVKDGQLILKCLPNTEQQTIQNNVANWFNNANGLQQNTTTKQKGTSTVKYLSFEFEDNFILNKLDASYLFYNNKQALNTSKFLLPIYIAIPWQPPEIKA